MSNKKLIFITQSMVGAGGVVRVITTWANYFANKGYSCEILSVVPGKSYFELAKKVKFDFVKFIFKFKVLFLPINIFLIVPILFRAKNAYLIVNKSAYIEPIYLWRKLGLFKSVKLIYFCHGGNNDFEQYYMVKWSTKHRVNMIFSVFDKVICLYKNTDKTPKEVIDEKIVYIKNPCPFDIFYRTSFFNNKVVSYIGRITKEKGIDILIKAWKKIENKDWQLIIVGDGKDKDKFISLSNELNIKNIKFIKSKNDIKPYLIDSTINVLPSLFDGMPMSIIEAKSQGCVVIATKTNGGKRLINDGIDGLLVKISDIDDLSIKINRLINSDELINKLRQNAYIQAEEFMIEKIAKKWSSILTNDK